MQSINTEVIPKVENIVTTIEESIVPSFRGIAENAVDVAKITGLPNLIKTAEDSAEKSETMGETFKQVGEVLTSYVEQQKKIARAAGLM